MKVYKDGTVLLNPREATAFTVMAVMCHGNGCLSTEALLNIDSGLSTSPELMGNKYFDVVDKLSEDSSLFSLEPDDN